MKVLLVNGSPHQRGCTYTALEEVAKTLEENGIETEIFQVGNKPINGCIGCGVCKKKGECFMDDKVNEFAKKAKECRWICIWISSTLCCSIRSFNIIFR